MLGLEMGSAGSIIAKGLDIRCLHRLVKYSGQSEITFSPFALVGPAITDGSYKDWSVIIQQLSPNFNITEAFREANHF